jgi:hypothetical protein
MCSLGSECFTLCRWSQLIDTTLCRFLLAATVAVFATGLLTTPALAGHCPKDVKKINAASSKMSGNKMSMAKDAVAKGLALHKSGKHGESIKVLHAAMKDLGIKH